MTLVDDADEFAHLAQDDTQIVLDGLSTREPEDEEEDEEIGDLADDDETQPVAMATTEFNLIVKERLAKHGHLVSVCWCPNPETITDTGTAWRRRRRR